MPVARYPGPDFLHPIVGYDKLVFLKNCITQPSIRVGAFTSFDVTGTPDARAEDFKTLNVLYLFDFIGAKLLIGSSCALGNGVRFLMNGANHELDPVSTSPFGIFSDGREAAAPPPTPGPAPARRSERGQRVRSIDPDSGFSYLRLTWRGSRGQATGSRLHA